jgi:hypothetical protein
VSEDTEEFDTPGGDDPRDDSGVALESLGDIRREMARVYRSMKAGRTKPGVGNCLTQTLVYLAKVIEQHREADASMADIPDQSLLDEVGRRANGDSRAVARSNGAH